MTTILIFDTECNGLSTEDGFIQELAFGIFDTDTWRSLKLSSCLIKWNRQYIVEPEALFVTGLSRDYCEQMGIPSMVAFGEFLGYGMNVDYVCGHNVLSYDLPMMTTNIKRALLAEYDCSPMAQKPVIDTLTDCPYPLTQKIMSLKYLAYDHGYILSDAHQAMADVLACKHILSKYDFNQVIEIAKTPLVTLTAKIDFNDIDSRDRIKQAKFYWNPARKLWEKIIREFHLSGTQLTLGDDIILNRE